MSKNVFTIKYRADGSIESMDSLRFFKLSNGVTTVRALCKHDPQEFRAYVNFELPNDERIDSRLMTASTPSNDGYFSYEYLLQSEELQYRGNLTMSVTFEEIMG